jgi:hypothetical protein
MEFEQDNDLVVVKAAQDEQGTDYLFISVDDLFSVGKPAERWRGPQCLNETKYVDRTLLLEAQAIELIFGERWKEPGLLIPTYAELQNMPELQMEKLFLRAINKRCKWSTFSEYNRSEYEFTKNADNIPIIHVTQEATDFIPGKAGWLAFREMLADPVAQGGRLIAYGSRSLIYRVTWEGRDFALKVLNLENEDRIDRHYARIKCARLDEDGRPNYLDRIGFLKKVVDLINEIPDLDLEITACQEYAYGHNFMLTELVSGFSMDKLYCENCREMQLPTKLCLTSVTQGFVDYFGLSSFDFSIACRIIGETVDPILKMLRLAKVWSNYGYWHHFTKNSLMVTGISENRHPKITLINQGVRRDMGSGDAPSEMMQCQKLWKDGKATYERLLKIPRYSSYFEKYFPDGWPGYVDPWGNSYSIEGEEVESEESEKEVTAVTT